MNKSLIFTTILGFIGWFSVGELQAQASYSSASVGMGKMRSNTASNSSNFLYQIPQPAEIVVEEYFNYHRHNIPMPNLGESVKMDMRWGNATTNAKGEGILQLGLTTQSLQMEDIQAVNVSLVIDRSGSMDGDRIKYARQAAKEFVNRLRPQDRISVVLFDDRMDVLVDNQEVAGNRAKLLQKMDQIIVRGGTDLNKGLMEGYDQVAKKYNSNMTNRVIMLTDALTNSGQIAPDQIVKNCSHYKDQYQIDISVIGVGVDFNNELSRQLTSNSKSSIHFINDAADIQKVFIDELEALMSPVARNVILEIEFDPSLQLEKFYGYQPEIKGNRIRMELNNMNNGLTQIMLARFKGEGQVKASLSFFDIQNKKTTKIEEQISISKGSGKLLSDASVKKNMTIAQIAETLYEMADLCHNKSDYKAAKKAVEKMVALANNRYPKFDKDLQMVYDILDKYNTTLTAAVKS